MYYKKTINILRLYENRFLVDVKAKYFLMETKMRGLDVIRSINRLQRTFRGFLAALHPPFFVDWVRYVFLSIYLSSIHCWRRNIKFFKYLNIKYSSSHFPYYILPTQNIHILQEVRFNHKRGLAMIKIEPT